MRKFEINKSIVCYRYMGIKRSMIIVLITFILVGLFIFLLKTRLYMYFFYSLCGIFTFILASKFGKELYLVVCLLEVYVSPLINTSIYNLDYNNNDGLNMLKIHPLTIVILVILFIEISQLIYKKKFKIDLLVTVGIITIVIFSTLTLIKRGKYGFPLLISNYYEPIGLFIYYYLIKEEIKFSKIKIILYLEIIISFFIGIFGIIEFLIKWNPLNVYFSQASWYDSQINDGYRIFTTIGHPLDNAFMFLATMVIVNIFIEQRLLKYFLLLFLNIVILLTGSRSIFIISVVLIMTNYKKTSIKKIGKELVLKCIATIMVIVFLVSPFSSTFMNRLRSGGESTESRLVLIDYFINNLRSFNINGIGSSDENIELHDSKNQLITFENPWIILFMDVSYIGLLYIIFLVLVIIKLDNRIDIFILLLALTTYNSFGVKGTTNTRLFLVLILSFLYQNYLNTKYSTKKLQL